MCKEWLFYPNSTNQLFLNSSFAIRSFKGPINILNPFIFIKKHIFKL